MNAQPPEARRPEGMQLDPEQEKLVGAPSKRARLAMVVAIVLIVLFVLGACVLDPDLLRRWLSLNEAWRLFGGPTPSN